VGETMRAIAKGVLGRITGLGTPAAAPAPAAMRAPAAAPVPAPVRPAPAAIVSVPAVGPVRPPAVTPLAPASPRATPSARRGALRRIVRTRT